MTNKIFKRVISNIAIRTTEAAVKELCDTVQTALLDEEEVNQAGVLEKLWLLETTAGRQQIEELTGGKQ